MHRLLRAAAGGVGLAVLTATAASAASAAPTSAPTLAPTPVSLHRVSTLDTTSVSANPSVVVSGGHLALKTGNTVQRYAFTGINAYQLASDWGVNYGCGWGGWNSGALNSFFSQMKPNSIVRTWAFQYLTTNRYTGQRDWSALDQMVAAADHYDVHLVLTLGNEDGTCDDAHWKDAAWYAGGYRDVYNPNGSTPESYAGYVHDIVSRYAGNPAIAMWEPMNEPQPASCSQENGPGPNCWGQLSCPDDAAANADLISFYDTVGAEIHRLDPRKLVSDGSFGNNECGTGTTAEWRKVIAATGIDVVGYHDYHGLVAQPADLAGRVAAATAIGKPTMIGESGVFGCASAAQQAQYYGLKMAAAWQLGVSAYVPWRYDNDNGQPQCNDVINFGSPSMNVIVANAHAVGSPTVDLALGSAARRVELRAVSPG